MHTAILIGHWLQRKPKVQGIHWKPFTVESLILMPQGSFRIKRRLIDGFVESIQSGLS